jgi:hypothetical protein
MDRKPKAADAAAEGWDCEQLILALVVTVVVQYVTLVYACEAGVAKIKLACVFDALVALRFIAAWALRQRDRGWIFYLVLLYSSPIWITATAWMITGKI